MGKLIADALATRGDRIYWTAWMSMNWLVITYSRNEITQLVERLERRGASLFRF
jgi:hypothetical protein